MKNLYKMKFLEKIKNLVSHENSAMDLHRMERYIPGKTILFDKDIEFVDACTYLGGYEHIFIKEIYCFNIDKKTPYILDCGSNIGLSLLYFKKLYPESCIVGFEPDPAIYKTLRNNVRSFRCSNIDLINKAVWINNGSIEFQIEGGFSGRIPKEGDITRLIRIPCIRLKDFLDREVDFLKIDIEGAEFEVLLDCKDRLVNVKNLFVEYHSHKSEKQNLHTLLEIISESGFRYHIHEAFTRKKPFVDRELMLGMDLQLDIFAYR